MHESTLTELAPKFFIDPEYASQLASLGLTTTENFFNTSMGQKLTKSTIGAHRERIAISLPRVQRRAYLKRYVKTPLKRQIKSWIMHRCIAPTAFYDHYNAVRLALAGINTPTTIAYGFEKDGFFEKRSFILSLEVPGNSLEKALPPYCRDMSQHSSKRKNEFISKLAKFARKFHDTGFRHRDFYLCHIFYNEPEFYLIDLTRCFEPKFAKWHYTVKDLAQLYFSAPGSVFAAKDRMRFLLAYLGDKKLDKAGKRLARAVLIKAADMAMHDHRHGRTAPFETA